MKLVTIYTDGSCSGNPGPGGWAAVLRHGEKERVITGSEPLTTNNRMELAAVVESLNVLRASCQVKVHTDSAYIVNAFKDGWIDNWIRRGWKTSGKQPVKNRDLWERLLEQTARHQVEFVKVKGHADDALNNRVDELAVAAMRLQ